MTQVVTCILLATLVSYGFTAPQCRDENGNPVDWYVLYKLPKMSSSRDYLIRKGLAYMFVTSQNPNNNWTLSSYSIGEASSMPSQTLSPIYNKDTTRTIFALYNDEPPNSSTTLTYGHSKGAVLAESDGGLWMIHSVPKFPYEPSGSFLNTVYQYPPNAARYGQSFLCISLASNQMNAVGQQLMFNRPKIFASNLPQGLDNLYPNLTQAIRNKFVRDAPFSSKIILKSRGGVPFISYAKNAKFGKDLYSGWVAGDLADDLQVETWSNGAGEMPSDCRSKYRVYDITDVALKINASVAVTFKNSQDHSKWAITVGADKNTVCIGDINRMTAQLKRGGGTVCVRHPGLWKRYSKSVAGLQPCPSF